MKQKIIRKGRETGKYGNFNMTNEEFLIFTDVAIENNGGDVDQAIQDAKFIDNALAMHQNFKLAQKPTSVTRSGYLRKGHSFHNHLNSLVDARMNDDL